MRAFLIFTSFIVSVLLHTSLFACEHGGHVRIVNDSHHTLRIIGKNGDNQTLKHSNEKNFCWYNHNKQLSSVDVWVINESDVKLSSTPDLTISFDVDEEMWAGQGSYKSYISHTKTIKYTKGCSNMSNNCTIHIEEY